VQDQLGARPRRGIRCRSAGAPLCRVHSDTLELDGLDIILKGGQMGPVDFFTEAASCSDRTAAADDELLSGDCPGLG
jgi:hypothetical protein